MNADSIHRATALLAAAPDRTLPLTGLCAALARTGHSPEPERLAAELRTAGLQVSPPPDVFPPLDLAPAEVRDRYRAALLELWIAAAHVSLRPPDRERVGDSTCDATVDSLALIDSSLATLANTPGAGELVGRIAEARAEYGVIRQAVEPGRTGR